MNGNGNGCLMIAVLAIVAIFICYYCNESSFRSKFQGVQPQAAKWAENLGMMGYGDSASNIQQDLNNARLYGSGYNPVAGTPQPTPAGSPKPTIHVVDNLDRRLAALEKIMEKEFHIKQSAWASDDISKANIYLQK
jgi:hypothetical protein